MIRNRLLDNLADYIGIDGIALDIESMMIHEFKDGGERYRLRIAPMNKCMTTLQFIEHIIEEIEEIAEVDFPDYTLCMSPIRTNNDRHVQEAFVWLQPKEQPQEEDTMKEPMVTSTVEKPSRTYDRKNLLKRGNLVEGINTGTVYLVVDDLGTTRSNYCLVVIHPGPDSVQVSVGETFLDSMKLKPYTGKIGLEMTW